MFGCNLDEVEESDLTKYVSLGDFFYRRLKPGVRPIAQAALVRFWSLLLLKSHIDDMNMGRYPPLMVQSYILERFTITAG